VTGKVAGCFWQRADHALPIYIGRIFVDAAYLGRRFIPFLELVW